MTLMFTSVKRLITITVSFEKISVADVMEINLLCKDSTKYIILDHSEGLYSHSEGLNSYFNLFT